MIEALSLFMLAQISQGQFPDDIVLTILLVYPFASLAICTLIGLGFRKLSTAVFGDLFFSPPARLVPATSSG